MDIDKLFKVDFKSIKYRNFDDQNDHLEHLSPNDINNKEPFHVHYVLIGFNQIKIYNIDCDEFTIIKDEDVEIRNGEERTFYFEWSRSRFSSSNKKSTKITFEFYKEHKILERFKQKEMQMEEVKDQTKPRVKCKVEYCEKEARNRGMCGSCLSLTRLRIKQGKLTPEQAQLLLNPRIRQGHKHNDRFDEWASKTLASINN